MRMSDPVKNLGDPLASLQKRLIDRAPAYAAAVEAEKRIEDSCIEMRLALRDRRKQMGLDQKTLADRLEVSQSAISKVENGGGDIGLMTILRYAAALDLSLKLTPTDNGITPVMQEVSDELTKAQEEMDQAQAKIANRLETVRAKIAATAAVPCL